MRVDLYNFFELWKYSIQYLDAKTFHHVLLMQDLSKYTVPASFVGMSVPTTVVGMQVA